VSTRNAPRGPRRRLPAPSFTEPKAIDVKALPRGEELRTYFDAYRGFPYLHLRKFYQAASGEWRPAKRLTIRPTEIPFLRQALEAAERFALENEMLDEESYESAGLELPDHFLLR
jgi:hypothetical protein